MKKTIIAAAICSVLLTACSYDDENIVENSKNMVETNTQTLAREVLLINDNWSYKREDGDIQKVSLPHSVDKLTVLTVQRNQDGSVSKPKHYEGMNYYSKSFQFNPIQGKRTYIEFDGSAFITKVLLNGKEVGTHTGGFSRFRFDLTEFLQNGNNDLSVMVDNTPYNEKVHDTAFLPANTGQDFTYYGGIYRDVKLVTVSDVNIDAEDYGSQGVYFLQKNTTPSLSDIYSNIRVRNKGNHDFTGYVKTLIKDKSDKIVFSRIDNVTIKNNDVNVLEDDFSLYSIHLWDGVNDPYLYTASVQIFSDAAKILDEVDIPLGLYFTEMSGKNGFKLNGKPYPLQGVAMHQDREKVGWSTTHEMRMEDLDLIHDMGATTVRFSHYPHNLDTGEYSNQLGFLNYLELPIVNRYYSPAIDGDKGEQYLDSAKEQMKELIRQNFNNPSMLFVGNANEIGLTEIFKDHEEDKANSDFLFSLQDTIKDEFSKRFDIDSSYRLTVQASVHPDKLDDPDWQAADVICHNMYFGWYFDSPSKINQYVEAAHKQYPSQPICISEYGAGSSIKSEFASDHPYLTNSVSFSQGKDHSSQYASKLHETYLKTFNTYPYISGTYAWNMFDFSVIGRDEGDTAGRNDKGLMLFDHKTKKELYYLYQSAWSKNPMVYIADKNYGEGEYVTNNDNVKVYSNLDSLFLTVNGQMVRSQQRYNNDKYLPSVFEFKNVGLTEGVNNIEVSGSYKGKTYNDNALRGFSPNKPLSIVKNGIDKTIAEEEGLVTSIGAIVDGSVHIDYINPENNEPVAVDTPAELKVNR